MDFDRQFGPWRCVIFLGGSGVARGRVYKTGDVVGGLWCFGPVELECRIMETIAEGKYGLFVVPFVCTARRGVAWSEIGVEEADLVDIVCWILRDRESAGRGLLSDEYIDEG